MNLPKSGECNPQQVCHIPYKVMLAKYSVENTHSSWTLPLAGSWAPAIILKLNI